MANKKVLIITYYWPPLGGSGVQRWLKFVKYLPQFGCQPFVFTPKNPAYELRDESLLKDIPPEAEVIRFPIWEPYEAAGRLMGVLGGSGQVANRKGFVPANQRPMEKVVSWVRGNVLIPDTRVFWVRPSVRFLTDYLKRHNIKTIVTTGPPHSMHLIGLGLKKKYPDLRWVADFRDPWSKWGFLESVMTGKIAMNIHRRLEAKVLKTADAVVTVTPSWVRQFQDLSNRPVHLITNGYDDDDFQGLEIKKTEKFVIRHAGFLSDRCNIQPFMSAMEELLQENEIFRELFRLDFLGEAHQKIKQKVRPFENLSARTTFTPPTLHEKMPAIYCTSSLLLLVLAGYKVAENLPGKIFEYMAAGLPILGIGPEHGDAAALLRKTGAGKMIDPGNKEEIKQFIREIFDRWAGMESWHRGIVDSEQYSRKNLTKALIELL